jgi:hypothetical protein
MDVARTVGIHQTSYAAGRRCDELVTICDENLHVRDGPLAEGAATGAPLDSRRPLAYDMTRSVDLVHLVHTVHLVKAELARNEGIYGNQQQDRQS